jgi:hypothetical protein
MNSPSHPVSDLIAKIQSTNNGYLFAPSGNEIALAKAHPSVFELKQNVFGFFPNKISLK